MSNVNEKNAVGRAIIFAVIGILNVIWLVCDLIHFAGNLTFPVGLSLFEFVVAAVYAIVGYKKPHGNLMRYLLLLYAAIAAGLLLLSSNYPTYVTAVYLVNILLVAYMAGRLDHYVQNVVISAIVLICNGVVTYYLIDRIASNGPLTFVKLGACIGCVTVWLAIAASYILRYKPHKEAGLADKN